MTSETTGTTITQRILALLSDFPNGLTTDDMATFLKVEKKSLRPKVSVLVESGTLRDSGRRMRREGARGPSLRIYVKVTPENQWTP
jgi:predicted ArsR family transcriptional regulator